MRERETGCAISVVRAPPSSAHVLAHVHSNRVRTRLVLQTFFGRACTTRMIFMVTYVWKQRGWCHDMYGVHVYMATRLGHALVLVRCGTNCATGCTQMRHAARLASESRVGDLQGRITYPEFVFLTTILAGASCGLVVVERARVLLGWCCCGVLLQHLTRRVVMRWWGWRFFRFLCVQSPWNTLRSLF